MSYNIEEYNFANLAKANSQTCFTMAFNCVSAPITASISQSVPQNFGFSFNLFEDYLESYIKRILIPLQ